MAVFLVRILYGYDYVPPEATGVFTDVPTSHWAAREIEQLYRAVRSTRIHEGTSEIQLLLIGRELKRLDKVDLDFQ